MPPASSTARAGRLGGCWRTAAICRPLRACPACPNAQRVLGADGKPRPGFSWGDPKETRGQQEMLEAEGVGFSSGAADPSRHLDTAAMAALVEQE
jgi:hypothetical protein